MVVRTKQERPEDAPFRKLLERKVMRRKSVFYIHVFDRSDNIRWFREKAVVDSGAVECVTGRECRT